MAQGHDADACGKCQFVAHADHIVVTPGQRAKAEVTPLRVMGWLFGRGDREDAIIELGRFTLPGWNGHLMFYLLQCMGCDQLYTDYAHGNRLYLQCPCGAQTRLEGERFYRESGLPKPLTPLQAMLAFRRSRRNSQP
jgi:hypothetical protein